MKKKLVCVLLAAMLLSTTACGKGTNNTATNTEVGTEITLAEAVSNEYGTIELCEYKGLDAQKAKYEITDDNVEEKIQEILAENQNMNPVSRELKDGDYVEMFLTAKVGDKTVYDYTQEKFCITAGEMELGEQFDKEIAGASTGKKFNFSIQYDDSFEDEALKGQKVDFEVSIEGVYEISDAELTDEFITETLGYSSEEDMRAQIKEQLQAEADNSAEYDMKTALLEKVVENSNVTQYDQGLYDEISKQIDEQYQGYMQMFGASSIEEIYEMFSIKEEDIEEEILYYVYAYVAMKQIAIQEKIEVSDEEYQATLEKYAAADGYEDIAKYEEEVGADNIRFQVLQDKVLQFLADNANVTEVDSSELKGDDGDEEIELGTEGEEIDLSELITTEVEE